jgi:hypothetical protein
MLTEPMSNSHINNDNFDIYDQENSKWQDKCINMMDTYGMLNMIRYIMIICALIFSYIGNPPSPKEITNCNPSSPKFNNTYCVDIYNILIEENDRTVYFILIVLVGMAGTFFIHLFLSFTKYITILLNTNGVKSGRGAFATFLAFVILGFILIRCFYCFASNDSKWRGFYFCANSKNKGLRILNNIWLQGIFTFCMILFLILAIKLLRTKDWNEFKKNITNTWMYFTTGEPYNNYSRRIYLAFNPPLIEGIPIVQQYSVSSLENPLLTEGVPIADQYSVSLLESTSNNRRNSY